MLSVGVMLGDGLRLSICLVICGLPLLTELKNLTRVLACELSSMAGEMGS